MKKQNSGHVVNISAVLADQPSVIEIAGPERAGLDELVGRFLGATKDPREVITDVDARYYGLVVKDQSLTPGTNPRIGATFLRTGSIVT